MNTTHAKSIALCALLMLLMAVTRSHHFDSLTHLPDASLAAFLLAGFYLPFIAFPILLVVAGLADYFAFNYASVSDWCFSPAYWFLIPTYAVLFYAGRFFAKRYQFTWYSLIEFAVIAASAISLAFLISNTSFYLLAGYFEKMSAWEYASSVAKYFMPYQISAFMYLSIAAVLHIVVAKRTHGKQLAG
ncbi:MAG: hypothetical protein ABL911_05970 [Gallionella sp.]